MTKNAAGNRLAATIKYLRGNAGIGLGTTTKYLAQVLCMLKTISLMNFQKQTSIT